MVEEFRRTAPLYSTDVHRAVRKGSPLFPLLENGFARITPAESRAIEDKWLGTSIISSDAIRFLSIFLVTFCILVIGLGVWIFVLRRAITAHTRTLKEELIWREHAEKELARANRTLQLFGILLQEELKSDIFCPPRVPHPDQPGQVRPKKPGDAWEMPADLKLYGGTRGNRPVHAEYWRPETGMDQHFQHLYICAFPSHGDRNRIRLNGQRGSRSLPSRYLRRSSRF